MQENLQEAWKQLQGSVSIGQNLEVVSLAVYMLLGGVVDAKQRLYGYKTLNLLNWAGDPSLMSTVLYSHIARQYTRLEQTRPARRAVPSAPCRRSGSGYTQTVDDRGLPQRYRGQCRGACGGPSGEPAELRAAAA